MEAERKALELVVAELEADPQGEFARTAFLEMLRRLPAVPVVPGKEVFFELARKGVLVAVELVLFGDSDEGTVLLTHRADEFFTGWHFPGTYREPRKPLIECAQRCADKEIGGIRITRVRQIGFFEHPDSPRFHDAGMLIVCYFDGTPEHGQWFSECPPDLIGVHQKYWPVVAEQLGR